MRAKERLNGKVVLNRPISVRFSEEKVYMLAIAAAVATVMATNVMNGTDIQRHTRRYSCTSRQTTSRSCSLHRHRRPYLAPHPIPSRLRRRAQCSILLGMMRAHT